MWQNNHYNNNFPQIWLDPRPDWVGPPDCVRGCHVWPKCKLPMFIRAVFLRFWRKVKEIFMPIWCQGEPAGHSDHHCEPWWEDRYTSRWKLSTWFNAEVWRLNWGGESSAPPHDHFWYILSDFFSQPNTTENNQKVVCTSPHTLISIFSILLLPTRFL